MDSSFTHIPPITDNLTRWDLNLRLCRWCWELRRAVCRVCSHETVSIGQRCRDGNPPPQASWILYVTKTSQRPWLSISSCLGELFHRGWKWSSSTAAVTSQPNYLSISKWSLWHFRRDLVMNTATQLCSNTGYHAYQSSSFRTSLRQDPL